MEKLEKNLQHLTSEYNSIVNERDRLLVISNQLQVQINRLRDRCRCVKNVDCRSIDNAEHDNVDIQDLDGLAKSIWAGPLINQSKPKQVRMNSKVSGSFDIGLIFLNCSAKFLKQRLTGNKSFRTCN